MELNATQREIVKFLSEKGSASNREIAGGASIDESTASKNAKKMVDGGVLVDLSSDFDNSTEYALADTVTVEKTYNYDRLLGAMKISFAESLLMGSYAMMSPWIMNNTGANIAQVVFLGCFLVFVPSFASSLYELNTKQGLYQTRITVTESGESK